MDSGRINPKCETTPDGERLSVQGPRDPSGYFANMTEDEKWHWIFQHRFGFNRRHRVPIRSRLRNIWFYFCDKLRKIFRGL